jgi:hypothetical protein
LSQPPYPSGRSLYSITEPTSSFGLFSRYEAGKGGGEKENITQNEEKYEKSKEALHGLGGAVVSDISKDLTPL